MKMVCESERLDHYLAECDNVNYNHPKIIEITNELFNMTQTETEKVKIAFEFVRDDISHSWDIQQKRSRVALQMYCYMGWEYAMPNHIC